MFAIRCAMLRMQIRGFVLWLEIIRKGDTFFADGSELGAALGDARRVADEADVGRRQAQAELKALSDRVEALEDRLTDAAAAAGQDANAGGAIALVREGDTIEIDIESIGVLSNPITA